MTRFVKNQKYGHTVPSPAIEDVQAWWYRVDYLRMSVNHYRAEQKTESADTILSANTIQFISSRNGTQ